MAHINRRDLLAALSASVMVSSCRRRLSGPEAMAMAPEDSPPLKALAQSKGIRFGSAMSAAQIDNPDYVRLMQRECAVLVAENAHKMYAIQPQRDRWQWAAADRLARFAADNQMPMRGHTLVWHHPRWMPDWVNNGQFFAREAERLLGTYIGRVAHRHRAQIYSWDVVNESVDHDDGSLRETSLSRAMGGTVEALDFCFRAARQAAPDCELAYNDYMSWESTSSRHRDGVLRLVEALVARGTPIDAIGLQSHSNYEMPVQYDRTRERAWAAFLDELKGMGITRFYITEFDVNDTRMGPDIATRDAAIASYTRDYLDLMFSYPETKDLLVWGLVDSMSWLQNFLPRDDGVEKRPTLFDSAYQPKPVYHAVADALRAAPVRS